MRNHFVDMSSCLMLIKYEYLKALAFSGFEKKKKASVICCFDGMTESVALGKKAPSSSVSDL